MSRSLAALAFAFTLFPLAAIAQYPADFEARLELIRNGDLFAENRFAQVSTGGRWTAASDTNGVKGLARFLRLEEHSFSVGDWLEGRARPLNFERRVKAVKTVEWSAEFDWDAGRVVSIHPDGKSTLDIRSGVVDEAALGMEIRAGLARGETGWTFSLLDEDEIEEARFRLRGSEQITTPLGCFDVKVVEKVRKSGSKRYTRTFYAIRHGYVPVRMEHGKVGGDRIESRIVELSVDGKAVPAGQACDAP